MKLRELELKDANGMLAWMKDEKVNCYFQFNAKERKIEDCISFIENSKKNKKELHYAIANDDDEYMGTISLKNINTEKKEAEYAIVVRSEFQGIGAAKFATKQILEIAFKKYGIESVYLNVLETNVHARKFYEHMGFKCEGKLYHNNKITEVEVKNEKIDLEWYSITKDMFYNKENILYKEIEFKELGDKKGKLVVAEALKEIPFNINRIFYIYGTDSDVVRGQHANKNSEFVLINVAGSCKVKVDTGDIQKIFDLDKPNKGLYLNKLVWKDMYEFSKDSILLVLASTLYDSTEYIRDYDKFKKSYIKEK